MQNQSHAGLERKRKGVQGWQCRARVWTAGLWAGWQWCCVEGERGKVWEGDEGEGLGVEG